MVFQCVILISLEKKKRIRMQEDEDVSPARAPAFICAARPRGAIPPGR